MVDTMKHEESVLWVDRLAFQASLSVDGLLPLQEPGTLGAAPWTFGGGPLRSFPVALHSLSL